ncbi:MAG: CHAT domain-containing protein, partial [bacterium]|nr:CHAT domain-containing protein [bacterium]
MPTAYKVTVTTAEKEKEKKETPFHISWQNLQTNAVEEFHQPPPGMPNEVMEQLWKKTGLQVMVGNRLFDFLDGDTGHLQRALKEAQENGEKLTLHLHAPHPISDWPFELLAREGMFLLPRQVHLVRSVSQWGAKKETAPQNHPMRLLFMACSPMDAGAELGFEREEEAIFKITGNLAIDMEVEDSGSLEGLRDQLETKEFDVVHISGHAGIDREGRPFFVMESETGTPCYVTPEELWRGALRENPPKLLFLSGCRTGEAPGNAAASFARLLVEAFHIPAVLGWGRSVSDFQATEMETAIYHELSRGKSIAAAVQRGRDDLMQRFTGIKDPAWPLLRVFGGGQWIGPLVAKGQKKRPQRRQMVHTFLKNSEVQVLAEGFVGRRRQLQQSVRTIKQDREKVGLLLLGMGGLGKSCLAGKISERFGSHTLAIVHGRLDAATLKPALEYAFVQARDEEGKQLLGQGKELKGTLADLCASSFKEKNYLILLDDFEQNLEGAKEGEPGKLLPEAAELLAMLLYYLPISEGMTHVMVTCRYGFGLTRQDRDLVKERLEWVWLTGFRESEQRKKARELTHILNHPDQTVGERLLEAGCGNPRLMEWLDALVGEMQEAEVKQLLEAVGDKKEAFIRDHVIRELLERGGQALAGFLAWLAVYRRPVKAEGVRWIAGKAGLE